MDKTAWAWFIGGVTLVLAVIAYFFYDPERGATAPSAGPAAPAAVQRPAPPVGSLPAAAAPGIEHPVPQQPPAESQAPLPGLGGSDPEMQRSFERLYGEEPMEAYLIPRDLIRRLVIMVDSLPKERLPEQSRAFRRIEGSFAVQAEGEQVLMADANAERYAGFVALVQKTDAARLVQVYFHYYPLFQKAYEELGYKNRYFNDRVVQVIDHLLATPDLAGPISLVRPRVMYEFTDPELQGLSAGQKALLRMGPGNAVVVKDKLRELRNEIVVGAPGAAGEH